MATELDKAFDALKTFDWGGDVKAIATIDDAVVTTHGDAAATKAVEKQLAAALKPELSRAAKDYVFRRLTVVGTADSVAVLAGFLGDKDNAHMARYALEQIPAPEAAASLRDALAKLTGALKVGVISSLAARRDAASVPALAALLGDADKKMAAAAATALGDIATPEAAAALTAAAKTSADEVKPSVVDGSFVCAERLLAAGKKSDAVAVYKTFSASAWPKNVRLAATHGLLTAAKN
jgi:HEAT repeat protein